MGGYGSGRSWGFSKKNTVEDCRNLDINRWMREGIVKPNTHRFGVWAWYRDKKKVASIGYESDCDGNSGYIRLFYTWNKTEKVDYQVPLVTTRPHFGGLRWWFICPILGCSRRAGKLYSPPGRKYFGCRECYDLTYTSCQDSHKFDALYEKIAKDVGTTPGFVRRVLLKKI
ncbi:MAG: hypothetical protein L6406_19770 [Desulfobacterales bacterium]|nr:hypothetical protein [Desulfobacterales bacterium]